MCTGSRLRSRLLPLQLVAAAAALNSPKGAATRTSNLGAAASRGERPARVEWSQSIWHSLEVDPGLAAYDMIGAEELLLTRNGSILSFAEATKCAPGPLGCEDNSGL